MDKDRVKGAVNDAAGRVKRQVGEWTNDPKAQVEGSVQQLHGKAQKALGNVKDAVRDESKSHERQSAIEHKSELVKEREARDEREHSGQHR